MRKIELSGRFQREWSRQFGLILFIAVISIVVNIRNNQFLTFTNIDDMLTNTAILSILAIGMLIVIVTGGIDLSIAATLAFSGMVTALTVEAYPGISPILAIIIGTVVGAICGAIIGLCIIKFNIAPMIVTLGFMSIYRGMTYLISNSSWVGAGDMSDSFMAIARGKVLGINNLIFAAIILYILAYFFLNYTSFGRQIYAVGSNGESALISGIKVKRVLFWVYSIMGSISGFAGVMWVSKFASAQGDTALGYEMSVIAACVLGGASLSGGSGKLTGIVLGSLLIGILNNALPLINVSPFLQSAIQGIIILFAVISNVEFRRSIEKNALLRRKI